MTIKSATPAPSRRARPDLDRGILLLALLLAPATASAQGLRRVSVDSNGTQGNGDTTPVPALTADGRLIVFESRASNLVPGDTNNSLDVFLHDRRTGSTSRVSLAANGGQGNGSSGLPGISSDGRIVVFSSSASNMVKADTNGLSDIFTRDLGSGTTARVSVDSQGAEADGLSRSPWISADGTTVAFESYATNLVPGDTNRALDVFVHDLATGVTVRASVDGSGNQVSRGAAGGPLSGDGRLVLMHSTAPDLVPGDTNGKEDLFLRDLVAGTITRVSVDASGNQLDGDSPWGVISADGRWVAFISGATNLVPGDNNGFDDIFLKDLLTGAVTRVNVSSSGVEADNPSTMPAISDDGSRVLFASWAKNLVPGSTNLYLDVYVHDCATGRTNRIDEGPTGQEGDMDSFGGRFSGDGRVVCFTSRATNLVPGDTNADEDAFLHGPYLTLEASTTNAPPGTNLGLTTWGGMSGGPALLFITAVNGSPLFKPITRGFFDAQGEWTVAGTVPPGFTGFALDFTSFGIDPESIVEASSAVTVAF